MGRLRSHNKRRRMRETKRHVSKREFYVHTLRQNVESIRTAVLTARQTTMDLSATFDATYEAMALNYQMMWRQQMLAGYRGIVSGESQSADGCLANPGTKMA